MIRSYWYNPDGTIECHLPPDRFRSALASDQGLLWVDIEGPEDDEIELLLEVFELHPLTVEDCIMPNVRPKLEDFERYLFVIMQGLKRVDGRFRPVELDVCLGKNFLITVRSEPIKSVDDDCARVEKKSPILKRGADFLFYSIADSLIDSYLPILDEVEARVDELETRLLTDSTEHVLRELLSVYNELMLLRRTLAPHREILSRFNRGDLPFIAPGNALYFRDIYDHLLRMSDLVDSCREVTTMSLEAYATIVSNRLNEIMKTLTAFATLALPFLIVTGIYGMNFSEHPELGPRWIYHLVSIGLVGSVPFMLFFFRKYKWL
ncbi:MAG: magnesium/cobalt transporter CorA [Candidatus Omnitrophica bacterium]|nr:magnesium/cobalt transporter CorA [Candidatus Omnitrophota bacterium]MBI3083270.1 magnesium/cobalt transporter CorA [Candidatus Omnitrophota bacterium]